jgi:hypothetical protein
VRTVQDLIDDLSRLEGRLLDETVFELFKRGPRALDRFAGYWESGATRAVQERIMASIRANWPRLQETLLEIPPRGMASHGVKFAIGLAPGDSLARRAQRCVDQGLSDTAACIVTALAQTGDDSADLAILRARLAMEACRPEAAVTELTRFHRVPGSQADVDLWLSRALIASGRPDEASKTLLQRVPGRPPQGAESLFEPVAVMVFGGLTAALARVIAAVAVQGDPQGCQDIAETLAACTCARAEAGAAQAERISDLLYAFKEDVDALRSVNSQMDGAPIPLEAAASELVGVSTRALERIRALCRRISALTHLRQDRVDVSAVAKRVAAGTKAETEAGMGECVVTGDEEAIALAVAGILEDVCSRPGASEVRLSVNRRDGEVCVLLAARFHGSSQVADTVLGLTHSARELPDAYVAAGRVARAHWGGFRVYHTGECFRVELAFPPEGPGALSPLQASLVQMLDPNSSRDAERIAGVLRALTPAEAARASVEAATQAEGDAWARGLERSDELIQTLVEGFESVRRMASSGAPSHVQVEACLARMAQGFTQAEQGEQGGALAGSVEWDVPQDAPYSVETRSALRSAHLMIEAAKSGALPSDQAALPGFLLGKAVQIEAERRLGGQVLAHRLLPRALDASRDRGKRRREMKPEVVQRVLADIPEGVSASRAKGGLERLLVRIVEGSARGLTDSPFLLGLAVLCFGLDYSPDVARPVGQALVRFGALAQDAEKAPGSVDMGELEDSAHTVLELLWAGGAR